MIQRLPKLASSAEPPPSSRPTGVRRTSHATGRQPRVEVGAAEHVEAGPLRGGRELRSVVAAPVARGARRGRSTPTGRPAPPPPRARRGRPPEPSSRRASTSSSRCSTTSRAVTGAGPAVAHRHRLRQRPGQREARVVRGGRGRARPCRAPCRRARWPAGPQALEEAAGAGPRRRPPRPLVPLPAQLVEHQAVLGRGTTSGRAPPAPWRRWRPPPSRRRRVASGDGVVRARSSVEASADAHRRARHLDAVLASGRTRLASTWDHRTGRPSRRRSARPARASTSTSKAKRSVTSGSMTTVGGRRGHALEAALGVELLGEPEAAQQQVEHAARTAPGSRAGCWSSALWAWARVP